MWLDSLSKLGRNRCSARVRENKKEIDAFFSFAWICCCSTKQQLALHTWTGGDWVTISYKSGEPSVISQALPSSWRRGLCKRRLGRILLWKNSDSTATRLERFISERDSASVSKIPMNKRTTPITMAWWAAAGKTPMLMETKERKQKRLLLQSLHCYNIDKISRHFGVPDEKENKAKDSFCEPRDLDISFHILSSSSCHFAKAFIL